MRRDLETWKTFLYNPNIYCRHFIELGPVTAVDINMYSDASLNLKTGGLGVICDNDWMAQKWDALFVKNNRISIDYLELFAVTAAVITWIHRFKNKHIYLFCDNQEVVHMINNSSSTCKNSMVLIRKITLISLIHNVRVFAKFVPTRSNCLADALSRGKMQKFWGIAPSSMNKNGTRVPEDIWPMSKVWLK